MCGSYRVNDRESAIFIDISTTMMVMYRGSATEGMVWNGLANGAGGEKYFCCGGEA